MKQTKPFSLSAAILVALSSLALHAQEAPNAADDFSSKSLSGGTGYWTTIWELGQSPQAGRGTDLGLDNEVLRVFGSSLASNQWVATRRGYAGAGTLPSTITFDFKVEKFPTSGGDANNDVFSITGNGTPIYEPSSTSTWIVMGGQNLSGVQPGLSNTWVFHDGKGDGTFQNGGTGENQLVDSGVALVQGHTYRFIVWDDPANTRYAVAVEDLDDPEKSFSSAILGYRVGTAPVNPYIIFNVRMSSRFDMGEFIIDNVSIHPPQAPVVQMESVDPGAETVTFEWNSTPGMAYDIYASATMEGNPQTDWEQVAVGVESGGGTTAHTETVSGDFPSKRFYKIYERAQ